NHSASASEAAATPISHAPQIDGVTYGGGHHGGDAASVYNAADQTFAPALHYTSQARDITSADVHPPTVYGQPDISNNVVNAQDGNTTVQQGDIHRQPTDGPPLVQHLPNADHMVQTTIASIEQMAAYWFDQKMQNQQVTDVKPLEPVFAAPIDSLGTVAYH